MPAGSICGSTVRYARYGRCLTCAAPGYYSQCRSDTTSTVSKRRWYVLGSLSGAIPRLYLTFYVIICCYMVKVTCCWCVAFYIKIVVTSCTIHWCRHAAESQQSEAGERRQEDRHFYLCIQWRHTPRTSSTGNSSLSPVASVCNDCSHSTGCI